MNTYIIKRMKILDNVDLAKLILRLAVGMLMLFHGYAKLNHGVGFIGQTLSNAGLPSFFAYGTYIGEIIAPILLILGVRVRLSALVIIFTMLTAIMLVHTQDILIITKQGAWVIEVQMFYILSSLSILFMGEGKYRIRKTLFEEKQNIDKSFLN